MASYPIAAVDEPTNEHGSQFLPNVAIQRLSLPGPSYRNAVIPPVAVRDLLTSPKFITTLFALGTEQKVYLTINTTVEPHMDGHARYIEQDLGLRSKSLRWHMRPNSLEIRGTTRYTPLQYQ